MSIFIDLFDASGTDLFAIGEDNLFDEVATAEVAPSLDRVSYVRGQTRIASVEGVRRRVVKQAQDRSVQA